MSHSPKIPAALIAVMLIPILVACGGGGASPSTGNGTGTSSPSTSIGSPSGSNSSEAPQQTSQTSGSVGAYDLDSLGVPRFVSTNYIDLSKITYISTFRSSTGHDYSDDTEKCRSMKHYFFAPDHAAVISSPVAGTIVGLYEEWAGTQVRIRSDAYRDFTFVIFHVALANGLKLEAKVTQGQTIGTHIGNQTFSDIAVEVDAKGGRRLVSYFETLTEAGFAPYLKRGIASPSALIVSKAARDASPLTCDGQYFTTAVDPLTRWVPFPAS